MPRWQTIVELTTLAAAVYLFLRWTAGNRLRFVLLSTAALFGLSGLAVRLELGLAAWVFQALGFVAVLLLVTIFQSELRHLAMRMEGRFRRRRTPESHSSAQQRIARAAFTLAAQKTGALVIIARDHSTSELAGGGLEIGAALSAALLEALFQKTSPIHDGGVIVEAGRIARAGVLLPLTHRTDVPDYFGTRHRAALGLCERCDAWVVVVSEERGDVTLVHGQQWRHAAREEELVELLRSGQAVPAGKPTPLLRGLLVGNYGQKLSAAAITAVVWGLSLVSSGTAIRDLVVPVEFTNPPTGMDVSQASATQFEMRVRGPRWEVESLHANEMSVRFDLNKEAPGVVTLTHPSDVVNLPPAVSVERLLPEAITVHLVPGRRAPPK
ncbi:diadenylate cyclase [uncultured Paludibaculum sp.]|uniref:diadenylate cyclase n=1 Tax=uncultured Paludibaculum sp. TaxID=1765020 RepID=UPI002AAC482C|nr:diadenylate cyclase [uncultured Paludibaculum sp.]